MRKWYPWLIVVLAFAFTAAVYRQLPERIPTHWNIAGEVDAYAPRSRGAWILPVLVLVMAGILPRLPALDPRRANYEKFQPSYDLVIAAIITMLALLQVAVLGVALGWPLSMERATPILVGSLLIVLGNVLPRARSNWLFGIRTPWTLSNDRVWERTHRLGGFLFVLAGVLVAACAFAAPRAVFPMIIGAVTVSSAVPIVYSYFAWRQESSRAPTS